MSEEPMWTDPFQVMAELTGISRNFEAREEFRKKAFAVPNDEVVAWMAQFSPIVEIGAGTGYWAKLLTEAGAQVDAYDIAPIGSDTPNEYKQMTESHFDVKKGGPEKAKLYHYATLFLCWPPYNTPMAYETLKAYTGDRLLFIGESWGGCTGDDQFFELLSDGWDRSDPPVNIESFEGLHDHLTLYERK